MRKHTYEKSLPGARLWTGDMKVEAAALEQIRNVTRLPILAGPVVVMPDVHLGRGATVGTVIPTRAAIVPAAVGVDIGCGMLAVKTDLAAADLPQSLYALRAQIERDVPVGFGYHKHALAPAGDAQALVLEQRMRVLEERFPKLRIQDALGRVDEARMWRQLGSLGGGNHFIELQRCEETGTLFVQVHTGSRGFGHGLATNYFEMAKDERPGDVTDIDLGYFTPESKHYGEYLDAVAAGGNFAILNRLIIFEQIAEAFRKVFKEDLELVYEISHNLVQAEDHPELGEVWVHRKGATRAFPGGHPALAGTIWQDTGHPVLIPGSNRDHSYILRPEAGAVKSVYSVNHGAGRRMSRGEAMRQLDQRKVDEQYRRDDILVNLDGRVPLDESGQCYKSCEEVVAAVVAAGLARVEHTLWPLASIKGNEEGAARARHRDRKGKDRSRDRERDAARRTKGHY